MDHKELFILECWLHLLYADKVKISHQINKYSAIQRFGVSISKVWGKYFLYKINTFIHYGHIQFDKSYTLHKISISNECCFF